MSRHYLVIHGHFYQPPRENPCIDSVEMQPSAWPYHDWNERVYTECYAPNGASRLLDNQGRIRAIVNNYEYFNFNFGPTLLSWMESRHPDTYARILDGDRISLERLGHGNAMAQAYNHTILPLDDEERKLRQIQWGLLDFEQRFGRKPEGMWLPETAVDMDSVLCLIRSGIKFIVLSPTQALRIRPLHTDHWIDISDGSINTHRPYRIFALNKEGMPLEKGYLDVFFYDGAISHEVGFAHLLRDAGGFAERILQAYDSHDMGDQLVSVCTDGESYGHHEPFADMCAAYLFHEHCAEKKLTPVNYGWYLAQHPPEFEVRLKNAFEGGTAWSCAHGVGRWKEDCGCHGGGQTGWNQKWRAPLRSSLNDLSGVLHSWLEQESRNHFREWKLAKSEAPNSWNADPARRQNFWTRHLLPGSRPERAQGLMEMLRFTDYMFTSCGWFFSDIAGLETIQVLRYALRAMRLHQESGGGTSVRTEFLKQISKAVSNLGHKTGEVLFLELEKELLPPQAYFSLARWAQSLSGETPFYAESPAFSFTGTESRDFSGFSVHEYRFRGESDFQTSAWIVYEGDGMDAKSYSVIIDPEGRLSDLITHPPKDAKALLKKKGNRVQIQAGQLPQDIRGMLASSLRKSYWQDNAEILSVIEQKLHSKQSRFLELGWPFPGTMASTLKVIGNFHLVEELEMALHGGSLPHLLKAVVLARVLREGGGHVHLGALRQEMRKKLLELGATFFVKPNVSQPNPLFALLDLVDSLGLISERTQLENMAFPLYRKLLDFQKTGKYSEPIKLEEAMGLLDRLNFSLDPTAEIPASERK